MHQSFMHPLLVSCDCRDDKHAWLDALRKAKVSSAPFSSCTVIGKYVDSSAKVLYTIMFMTQASDHELNKH